MLLLIRCTVNHIALFSEQCEHFWNLFRWILQIIVQSNRALISSNPNATQQGIVLTKIAHEADSEHPRILLHQFGYDFPASVVAAVVHQDSLVFGGAGI